MLWKKANDSAVSEVVGNLLILMITVALFGVVLGFVYSIPGPEPTIQAEIVPMLERTSAVDGKLHLQHTGGEPLTEGETYILVSIDDSPQRFNISDGLGGKQVMEPGDTWSMDFLGTISTSAKVDVKIVDATSNSLLFYTVVQRGVSASGNHDPIIAYAWADTTSGSDVLQNNDYTTWRIYAVCKDIDGDLPQTGSVTASVTANDNGDGTFSVMAFAGGPAPMSDITGDGVYISGLLKVHTTVAPGDYSFTVTATDDGGRTATATVRVTVSTSQSSLRITGTDEAPSILKAGQSDKLFLKLEFLARGESIHVNTISIKKLGNIPDDSVTFHCFWDKDRDGVLNMGTDYDLPGWGHPGGGSHEKHFTSGPLFTAIEDEPTLVWVVISVAGGTEGYSVGVRVQSQASVKAIGVSTPVVIPPIGSFSIDSSELTIKGVFKVYGYNRHPTRILTGTNDVKMIELRFEATGETVYIQTINLTLLGTIAHDQVTVYLKDEWNNVLTGNMAFDAMTRRVSLNGNWKVDEAWSDRQIYVYFNVLGNNADTIGVRVDTVLDVHALTELSGDDINPQAPWGEPIPNPPSVRTLQSEGYVTLDREQSTEMPSRAGDTYVYQRRWLYRCYGEPIDFNSFKVTLQGTIPFDRVINVRLRIYDDWTHGLSWEMVEAFASNRTATFENALPIPLFTVPVNSDFYGWVRVDSYVYLDHGTEGMTIRTGLAAAADTGLTGQITGTGIVPAPYGGGDIPTWSDTRTVNGQMYVYGTSLIPSPLVDSSQNVPVHKITFKCEGQNVRVNSITIRKLGTVAQNQVTVRIYRDVDNDTTTNLDGDDVELDSTHAGNFIGNAITFTPNFWVTVGTDYNVVIAFSLGLGTASWSLGSQVRANEVSTTTDVPNSRSAYPNQCLNASRNPPLNMNTPTVPISDRGALHVHMEDLSPMWPSHGHIYEWMKLTFVAEGEDVDVNRIAFNLYNLTAPEYDDWEGIRVGLIRDDNNNSVWEIGSEPVLQSRWVDSNGEVSFLALPLFVAKKRVEYNLLVVVGFDPWLDGHVIMNISSEGDIQSKGQVSVLSITPTGAFPMETAERYVWHP